MSGDLCPFSWIQITEAPGCLAGLFGAKPELVWKAQPCMESQCKLWDYSQNNCGLITKNQSPTSTLEKRDETEMLVNIPRTVKSESSTSLNRNDVKHVKSTSPLYEKPDQSSAIIYHVDPIHKITIIEKFEGFYKVKVTIGFDSELEGYMLSNDIFG